MEQKETKKSKSTKRIVLNFIATFVMTVVSVCGAFACYFIFSGEDVNQIKTVIWQLIGVNVLMAFLFFLCQQLWQLISVYKPMKKLCEWNKKLMLGAYASKLKDSDYKKDTILGNAIEEFSKLPVQLEMDVAQEQKWIENISKTLSTDFTVIQNYATLLAGGACTDQEEKANKILSSAQTIENRFLDIQKLKKIEYLSLQEEKKVFSLSDVLIQEIKAKDEWITRQGLHVDTDIDEKVQMHGKAEIVQLLLQELMQKLMDAAKGETYIFTLKKHKKIAEMVISTTKSMDDFPKQWLVVEKAVKSQGSYYQISTEDGKTVLRLTFVIK